MDKYLVPLVDGGIREIEYDSEMNSGCDTCDYGSSYVNEYIIKMSNGKIKVKVNQMYEHALSEAFMMSLFLTNIDTIRTMTEDSFFEWLKVEVEKGTKDSIYDPETTIEFLK